MKGILTLACITNFWAVISLTKVRKAHVAGGLTDGSLLIGQPGNDDVFEWSYTASQANLEFAPAGLRGRRL